MLFIGPHYYIEAFFILTVDCELSVLGTSFIHVYLCMDIDVSMHEAL